MAVTPSVADEPGELFGAELATPFGALAVITQPGMSGDIAAGEEGPVIASGFLSLHELCRDRNIPVDLVAVRTLPTVEGALGRYLAGDASALGEVSVAQDGTRFSLGVWEVLREVPAGETVTYGELAAAAGSPGAARAAGHACATNAVAPFVPCHRVVPSSGGVGQYGYGADVKAALLAHERAVDSP